MKENIIKTKSFNFAKRTIRLYKVLTTERKEVIISRQLLKSGTSIGANVREALNAESLPDFIHKMGIAQKESDETLYWLELLNGEYLSEAEFNSVYADALEILKIIRSIIVSSKKRIHNL